MNMELAQRSHLQLSQRGMDDNIWKVVAPDLVGRNIRELRFIINLITDCNLARATLAVGQFLNLMTDYYGWSLPTAKTQLERVIDYGYADRKRDCNDGRIVRLHASRKAIRAIKDAEKYTALRNRFLDKLHGEILFDISEEMLDTFFAEIAYDAAEVIHKERGRRKAQI
jgi:DNA-binding MarR family transcriptional regulator